MPGGVPGADGLPGPAAGDGSGGAGRAGVGLPVPVPVPWPVATVSLLVSGLGAAGDQPAGITEALG